PWAIFNQTVEYVSRGFLGAKELRPTWPSGHDRQATTKTVTRGRRSMFLQRRARAMKRRDSPNLWSGPGRLAGALGASVVVCSVRSHTRARVSRVRGVEAHLIQGRATPDEELSMTTFRFPQRSRRLATIRWWMVTGSLTLLSVAGCGQSGGASGTGTGGGAQAGAHGNGGSGPTGAGGTAAASGTGGSSGLTGAGGTSSGNSDAAIPIGGGLDGSYTCTPGVEELVITDCGYPTTSSNPLTSTAFNENGVLRAIRPAGSWPNGVVQMFYNDEHAMTLGVREVVVKSSTGSTTMDYPVTALSTDPGSSTDPQIGTNMLAGDESGLDSSLRPMWPSLFVTDITADASSRSGDWQ